MITFSRMRMAVAPGWRPVALIIQARGRASGCLPMAARNRAPDDTLDLRPHNKGTVIMSFFGSIVDKIVGYASSAFAPAAAAAAPAETAATPPVAPGAPPVTDVAPPPAASSPDAPPPAASLQSVDVGAVLTALDAQKGGGLNWQSSIVDLLKLLDLDSSLQARKTLASELDVHVGADGSAEENIALHKAVVQKLEENGGKVPAEMKG